MTTPSLASMRRRCFDCGSRRTDCVRSILCPDCRVRVRIKSHVYLSSTHKPTTLHVLRLLAQRDPLLTQKQVASAANTTIKHVLWTQKNRRHVEQTK